MHRSGVPRSRPGRVHVTLLRRFRTIRTASFDLEFSRGSFARRTASSSFTYFAYSDLTFYGYAGPDLLAGPAGTSALQFFRHARLQHARAAGVGFCVGNPQIVSALTRIKPHS